MDEFGGKANDLTAALCLPRLRGLSDALQIISRCFGNGFTDCVDLLYDWVFWRFHNYSFASSSGVQMTGGTKPAARQIASIVLRMAALAICVQFQLNR